MAYLIIAAALLFIIVPIIGVLPSARQKAQMTMRNVARGAGVTVEITVIEDPNPDQEKYISNLGRKLEPKLNVAGWRLQRRRDRDWRQLPRVDWCLKRNLDSSWRWEPAPPPAMNPALVAWLDGTVQSLPADVEQVREQAYTIEVFWHEREPGSETQVIEFLRGCAALPLHAPDDENPDDETGRAGAVD